ncbi:MAG: hypothetical protein HY565_01285, partial [Candidatus Kerfeldbacteria bacterium]|nr:hypothetical protein [Candidatus Kerfeldbacteria bacterium]
MNKSKYIIISTVAASLLVLAGCTTQTATNTNTNKVSQNINSEVVTNTNVEQGSEVDTSDWLTYTNDEYGFSFKYPSDWEVKDLGQATIGLISPELEVELAKGPNSTTSSDLMFIINKPSTEANYITGDFVDSLTAAKNRGDIRELNFSSNNSRAKFIEHN